MEVKKITYTDADSILGVLDDFNHRIKSIDSDVRRMSSHVYSAGDISAIHGQIDNLEKYDEYQDHEIKNLQQRVYTLEIWQEVAIENNSQDKQRIKKIEKNVADLSTTELIDSDHEERLDDLENLSTEKRLLELEKKIESLLAWKTVHLEDVLTQRFNKKPNKCPACDGAAFHNIRQNPLIQIAHECIRECSICSSHAKHCSHCTEIANAIKEMEKCKSCKGEGIVWG